MGVGPRVGIRQVAEAAGVSVTTVSHALNGKGRLPEATRERVQRIATELGYRPSRAARNLVGGRTGLLGLSVSQPDGQAFALGDFAYFVELMSAATGIAMDHGYGLVLAPGRGTWTGIDLDGAIVVDPLAGDPIVASMRERGIPVVTAGRVPGDPSQDWWVDNDHVKGARKVLDHLAGRGATRVAMVSTPAWTSYATDALETYHRWCDEHDVEPRVAYANEELTEAGGFAAASELLASPEPPDGIWASLDRLALGVLLAARARDVRVPDDLLVVGTTDSDAGRWASPALTALNLHPQEIGRAAVTMLLDLVEGREPPRRHVLVGTRLIARASTRRTE
jgi:DNA-binding LacI/PurR family transcriptional regulator